MVAASRGWPTMRRVVPAVYSAFIFFISALSRF
jgi:hypothetical protein